MAILAEVKEGDQERKRKGRRREEEEDSGRESETEAAPGLVRAPSDRSPP